MRTFGEIIAIVTWVGFCLLCFLAAMTPRKGKGPSGP